MTPRLPRTETVELTQEEFGHDEGADAVGARCRKALLKALPELPDDVEVVSLSSDRLHPDVIRYDVADGASNHSVFFVEYAPGSRRFVLLGYTDQIKLRLMAQNQPLLREGLHYVHVRQLEPVAFLKTKDRCIPAEASGFCIAPIEENEPVVNVTAIK